MRLLVLGGTQDVGGAVVETALARGDQVTTLNRGVSGPPAAGAQPLHADRTDRAAVAAALGASSWDAVIDTWSGAPVAVSQSAALLAGRANLVWVPPEVIEAAGIEPWTELPVWVPPTGEYTGLHNGDVSAAYAAGLSCRPVAETVANTWRWLQAEATRRSVPAGRPTASTRTASSRYWPAWPAEPPAGQAQRQRRVDFGVFTLSAATLRITRPCGPIGLL